MAKKQTKKKGRAVKPTSPPPPKDFLDMIAPAAVKFNTDSYILGGAYHCTLALRGYPTSTEELALLQHLGEKSGVTLHIYARQVTAAEENAILHNATNRSRMERGNTNDMKQSITAEANLQDVAALITTMHRNREPLEHCAVFMELSARDADGLRSLRDDVTAELTRSKLNADRILLRQREGFLASNPAGSNVFGSLYERVLPASSVANLYPINYSGKNDPNGFYIGRDRYGSNIIVDLDRRAEDKTTASVLILGNSGQGKSYLLKLLLCNILESGKSAICLDPEHELIDLCANLGGCFADLMSGQYIINPLEPKLWDTEGEDDPEAPAAFRQRTRLSQHVSFLKDFFRAYKDFSDRHIDTIELMLERLYKNWGMNNHTNFQSIVDELAKDTRVAAAYDLWYSLREEVLRTYRDDLPQRLPLSQQKEFKQIKNLVIEEAVRLGRHTEIFDPTDGQEMMLEDTEPESPDGWPLHGTESDRDMDTASVYAEQSAILGNPHAKYRAAKRILASPSAAPEQTGDAVIWLTQAAEAGLDDAQYTLGRLYLDGVSVARDTTLAVIWFSRAAEQGNPQAMYVLGKLNLEAGNHPAALRWFQRTAELGNPFAQYQIGKLLLTSGEKQSDMESAIRWLTESAEHGNQFAQYALGKLYLLEKDVPQDYEAAVHWLTLAAGQGNPYAQFYLEHAESSPSLFTCATRLLHHMGNIFQEQAPPSSGGVSFVDSKLRRKIREKKIAMGHKPDDHENPEIAPRQI